MQSHTGAPRKVLIFSLAYYPRCVGGAEVALKEITDRIDPKEIEFHMVCLRFDATLPKVEQVGHVLVHRIGPVRPSPDASDLKRWPLQHAKYVYQITAAWKAILLHRDYRYHGVWVMMAHSCGVPAALFSLVYPQVPLVLTLQEGDPPERIERMFRPLWPLFARAFTHARVVQTISTFLADWARTCGAVCPVEVIPNGVTVAQFTAHISDTLRAERCAQLGKKKGDKYLITTSRLVHKNAVDDVVRALKWLPDTVGFAVLGVGPDEAMLRALAKHEGVASRVHFLGHVEHADIPSYLAACDIFVRPSRSEGMGNSFIEAMAAGLPVIATQEGGIRDFLFDARKNPDMSPTGWAVTKDSPHEIADVVRDMLAHPEKVAEVAAHARAFVIARYDWDHIVQSMRTRVFSHLFFR